MSPPKPVSKRDRGDMDVAAYITGVAKDLQYHHTEQGLALTFRRLLLAVQSQTLRHVTIPGMSPDKFRACLAVLLAVGLSLLAWSQWTQARGGPDRFQYISNDPGSGATIFDRHTGTVYWLNNRVWSEVHPQTGQTIDRAYEKIN
jgi:hypothetical protein